MNTIKIKPTDEASQGPFVIIARADFNPDIHEALDPADLANADEQPCALTAKDLDDARLEIDSKYRTLESGEALLNAVRERLDAQAADQEVERQRLATLASDLEFERARLAELAAKPAEQGADAAKPLTVAELREELTARAIEFDPAAKKADLQALLDAADSK